MPLRVEAAAQHLAPRAHRVIAESLYRNYFQRLLAGDRGSCRAIVADLLSAGIEIKTLYLDLFQRSLYDVGDLWERRVVSVAVEHLATAITESLLTLVYPRLFAGPQTGRKAVIACVANEYHQIGGKMVADLFELRGWRGYFLGANTPVGDLFRLVEEQRPEVLGLSLSIYFRLPDLLQALDQAPTRARGIRVFVGGQAFRFGGAAALARYPNAEYIASLDQLDEVLANY